MKAAYQQIHSSQLIDHQPQSSIYLISTRQHFSKHPTTRKPTTIQKKKKKKKKKSLINHKPPTTKDRTQHDHATLRPILRRAVTKTTANLSHAVSGTPQPRAIQQDLQPSLTADCGFFVRSLNSSFIDSSAKL